MFECVRFPFDCGTGRDKSDLNFKHSSQRYCCFNNACIFLVEGRGGGSVRVSLMCVSACECMCVCVCV